MLSVAFPLAWTKPTRYEPAPVAFSVTVSGWFEPKTTTSFTPEPPPELTTSIPAVLPGTIVST